MIIYIIFIILFIILIYNLTPCFIFKEWFNNYSDNDNNDEYII